MPADVNVNPKASMDALLLPSWKVLVGAALLATAGWRHPFARGLTVGAGGLGAFVLARRWLASRERRAEARGTERRKPSARVSRPFQVVETTREPEPFDVVDIASEASFPASDPPAFIGRRATSRTAAGAHTTERQGDGPEDEWSPREPEHRANDRR